MLNFRSACDASVPSILFVISGRPCLPARSRPRLASRAVGMRRSESTAPTAVDVPFRFELATDGAQAKGSFFDGDVKVTSSAGRFENGTLRSPSISTRRC